MEYKDYYKVMGLSPEADAKEIKTAYRKLARKYHPDINKEANAEEKFKELGEAYEVLKDPEKRRVYDQYRTQKDYSQQNYNYSPWTDESPDYQYTHDFFESLFGAAPQFRQRARKSADYHGQVNISLEDAYKGTVHEIQLPGDRTHPAQKIKVKIPAGVKTGQQIRVPGKGMPAVGGGIAGDLFLTINVLKHSLFDVVGNDIYITVPITPWEAALGCSIQVPTLAGKVDLKISPASQGGQTLRLKNRGLPGKEPGNQYVILKIVIPKPQTDAAKELYKKMAAEMPFNPREHWGR